MRGGWIRMAVVVSIVASAWTWAPGFAAGLTDASKTVGSNKATVPHCDNDGVTLLQNLSGANVVSVTVGGIASACATGSLSVALNNGTTSSSGSATVPAGGGSMTVTLSVAVAAKEADQIDVAISGP